MAGSTPRLSEYARKFVYPPSITMTVWPRVEAKGVELGFQFDWWQSQLGTVCLGYGADGKYVATVGGVGMSIPRQVGKTYFVLALLVVMCVLFPGLQVVWTAHHLRTSTKTFTSLRGICGRKRVAPHVRSMRAANGEQQVEFANGSMIMFGARSMGFGRGFDEIDIEVFDEAQILDTKALEDMVAATNQSRHKYGALLFFMGTPPRPTDPSGAFTERRAEAWSGDAEDSIWLEIGADPGSDPNDRGEWRRMNPSFPQRTPLESLLRLRKNLKDEDSWNREGRGVWDDDGRTRVINLARWADLADVEYAVSDALMFAVETDPGREWSAIAAVGPYCTCVPPRSSCDLSTLFVDVVEHGRGTGWVVDRCKALGARHEGVSFVVDRGGPAASLLPELKAAGLPVVEAGAADVAAAYGLFVDGVKKGTVRHGRAAPLEDAVRVCKTRPCGDGGQAFGRKVSGADITALVAASNAHWAARSIQKVTPTVWSLAEMIAELKAEQETSR